MRDNNGFEIRFRNVYAIAERMPMPMPVNILGESIDTCSKIIMPTKHIIAEIMWLITMAFGPKGFNKCCNNWKCKRGTLGRWQYQNTQPL